MILRNIFVGTFLCLSVCAFSQEKLEILHTNDTHSCIEPLSKNLADTMMAGRAGFVRRLTMIDEERKKNPDLLLFDSGDFSQGSPYYNIYKGDVEVGLMNLMKYDAVAIGNHEFDFGIDNMVRIFKMAKFPVVCANYDFAGTALKNIVKPWIILKRKGIKIGVFGISPQLDGLVTAKNYGPIKYLSPSKTALEVASYLKKKKKCDIVICISHLGWEEDGSGDIELIKNSRDIDVVLGGHSHTYFKKLRYVKNMDGKMIPDDQNGKSAIYVGKIILNFKKD